ncbi:MAG: hypothetical protein IJW48_02010 [Clostridia bacterium]|nr:hypothetical protein [Clostridia bacterium]
MKRANETKDKSSVYRTNGFGKITAPSPLPKGEPRGTKISGRGDLRGGNK